MQDITKLLNTIETHHITEDISDPFEALRIQLKHEHEHVSFDYQVEYYVNNISVLQIDEKSDIPIKKQYIIIIILCC